ncbi:MAG TPA: hypothetical protein VNS52_08410 [Gemmatimonadaceae bacterium]|nr:hypothetical protein [Gemmatimonadaceae bacterium]
MAEAIASPLSAWESFYVIVGSSAAALTGLMFVVISLVADIGDSGGSTELAAFGTPNVVHFCAVLVLAAIVTAPWQALGSAAVAFGLAGVAGLGYVAIVVRRARRTTQYRPVFEDWLWHTILPTIAYATLFGAAVTLRGDPASSLFAVAAAALALLFIGIHNAWDTVTWVAIERVASRRRRQEKPAGAEARAADAPEREHSDADAAAAPSA